MNVVCASNEAYTWHSAVSFTSLYDCSPDEEELTVYLLDTGIWTETAEKLQALAADFGRELIFLPYENLEERFPERPDTGRFNLSTLRRFFLGELLSSEVERVLYLSCDTVAQRNLHRMHTADLRGALLAMAEELTVYREVKIRLGMLPEASYSSAGVTSVDLAHWRTEDIGRQSLGYYESVASYYFFQDQDAINGLLRRCIAILHPAYNFTTNYYYFSYASSEVFSSAYRKISEWRFEATERHPAILHYAGDGRPQRQGAYNPYERVYFCYLARIPWKDTAPEGGRQAHLLCYHGMNLLTRHFPSPRSTIGRCYVKKSAEERRRKMREAGKV